MTCKKGGDITYELLSEVCKGVENELMLQTLTGETQRKQRTTQDWTRVLKFLLQ